MELANRLKCVQNIIIVEPLFLDHQANEEKGNSIEVVTDGYITAKKRAIDELGGTGVYRLVWPELFPSLKAMCKLRKAAGEHLDYVDGLEWIARRRAHPYANMWRVTGYRRYGLFL